MKNDFLKQGLHLSLIYEQLERISLVHRIDLIPEKDTTKIRHQNTFYKYIKSISTKYYKNH